METVWLNGLRLKLCCRLLLPGVDEDEAVVGLLMTNWGAETGGNEGRERNQAILRWMWPKESRWKKAKRK